MTSQMETPLLSDIVGTDEIYIIFGGPSLKGFDFSKLNGKFTLGCNKCAFEVKTCAISSIDNTFINSNRHALRDYRGYTILGSCETNKSPMYQDQRIVDWIKPDYLYWYNKKDPDKMSTKRGVLCGANTGHASINFAMLEGFKTIHALGLDLGKRGWWHSGYSSSAGTQWMNIWASNLDKCKPFLDDKGVRLINYNPDSAVRAYEFGDLKGI